jgi:hypothetical protein
MKRARVEKRIVDKDLEREGVRDATSLCSTRLYRISTINDWRTP